MRRGFEDRPGIPLSASAENSACARRRRGALLLPEGRVERFIYERDRGDRRTLGSFVSSVGVMSRGTDDPARTGDSARFAAEAMEERADMAFRCEDVEILVWCLRVGRVEMVGRRSLPMGL